MTTHATTLLNLHGYPACGKTTLALMIAEGLTTWPPPKGHVFKSVAYIGWDRGGLDGVKTVGCTVPNALDMSLLMSPPRPGEAKRPYLTTPMAAMTYVQNWLRELATKTSEVNFVIEDTCTARNRTFFHEICTEAGVDTKRDEQRAYGKLGILEGQYYQGLNTCGIPVVIGLYHTVAVHKEADEPLEARVKRLQYQMGRETVSEGPEMKGQAIRLYSAEPSLEATLRRAVGPNGKDARFVHVESLPESRGKNRFGPMFQNKMKAEDFITTYRSCIIQSETT